ncbi:MAG: hypothetical protein GXP62_06580 [Oligoflexia bacterium]|nr:hypothetical protein [Oligoflexia bacterium]
MEEHALRRKLQAIKALHDGATTAGERAAAAQARDRVFLRLLKLGLVRRASVHAVFRHAAGLGGTHLGAGQSSDELDPLIDPIEVSLPSCEDLLLVLAAWRMGLRSRADVRAWAARLCDQLLLPSVDIHDPRAARVEVLLQLAAMESQPLDPVDAPAIERFLRAEPGETAWAEWFSWLSSLDWRARRAV